MPDNGMLQGVRPGSGLPRVRRYFVIFAVALTLVSLPGLLGPDLDWTWRVVHVGAVGWLLVHWWSEHRHGPAPVVWDGMDAAALLVLCLPVTAFPAIGLFYGACYWRSVSSSTPRAVAAISIHGGLLLAVLTVKESMPPPAALGPVFGLVASSLLIHLVVATMSRHETALHSERELMTAVLENLETGVIATDAEGQLTLVNDAAHALHPTPVETTSQHDIAGRYGLFGPDGVTPLRATELPVARALRGEHVHNQEVVMVADAGQRTILANGCPIDDEDGRRMGAVLALHDVTDIKQAQAALRRQAMHDPLTDLPNREQLQQWLDKALGDQEGSQRLALLFVDLDGFKTVNDSLGHSTGDSVLQEVGRRLLEATGRRGRVARLGGDEFAVLVQDAADCVLTVLAEEVVARLSLDPPMNVPR